jgi:2-desacetyl-2-hydroxyethyl bacteriochlorophyllide A dehydrogenase
MCQERSASGSTCDTFLTAIEQSEMCTGSHTHENNRNIMKTQTVVFPAAYEAVLEESDMEIAARDAGDIFLKNEYSVLSAGTENALYKGTESWAPHPIKPGYGSVGKAVSVGKGFEDIKEGDLVFTYGNHSTYVKGNRMIIKVPEGVDPKAAVLARMAQVSFTSLRASDAALGDYVAVIGQGLVGNIAAQLFVNSGCTVIAIDVMHTRLNLAKQCGVDHVINAMEEDVVEKIKEITGGCKCSTVVEASGIPSQVLTASKCAAKKGEVLLLGTPRGEFKGDTLELLHNIHIWDNGCVTLKGAHEWRYPDFIAPNAEYKFSLEGNIKNYFDLLKKGKLIIEPLISHVANPADAPEIYKQINEQNQDFMGVVFKWN